MTVCTDADIVTTALLAGDDELSRRLVKLKNSKNAYEEQIGKLELQIDPANPDATIWKKKHALDLKNESVDMQIRQIVNYKILTWDKQAWAYEKLAKSMIEQGRDAWATISLLEKLDNSNPLDLSSVAEYFKKPWEAVSDSIERIKDNIANVWSAIAEQEKYIKSIKTVNELVKEWKSKEEISKIIKERAEADKKNIKEWLNPNNFADPDSEWTVIKNTVEWVDNQHRAWWQYILGKAIIWDADAWTLREIKKIYETQNTVWKLTPSQIFEINSVDELMARAYTNVNDLVDDWLLREAYKNKLTQLMTWMWVWTEKRLGKWLVDMEYAERLITLSRFAEDWAAFSDLVRYDAVWEAARKMWIKVDNSESFYKSLIKTLKEDTYLDNISKDWKVKLTDWTELTVNNMLELTYIATWDRSLPRLLREGTFSESSLLDIGTQLLLWNKKEASRKILRLINKVKELPSIADSKEIALMTLTWKKIQPWAKKGFFNYRSMYSWDNMLPETKLKADFMERMANANRAQISVDWIEDLSSLKWAALEKKLKEFEWWYIIVNDSWWMNNIEFKDALNKVNKDIKDESQKIQVLFPRQAQMSNFTMENGNLIFRSVDRWAFRDIMDNVSVRTLWDANATKELQADMFEMINGMNWDKVRYQATYNNWAIDNLGNKLSDQQNSFFQKSRMRDDNGNLIKVYRWRWDRTPRQSFWKNWWEYRYWDQLTLFFSDSKAMWNLYAWAWVRKAWGKRIKNLKDARKELNARWIAEDLFEITEPTKWNYVITARQKVWYRDRSYEVWDTIFEWNIDELDRYLIDEENITNMWSDPRRYECYLYAENPLVVDAKWAYFNSIDFNWSKMSTDEISVWAAANWYDGVIFKDVVEIPTVWKVNDYVVFSESQIKWVDNQLPTLDSNWRYQTAYHWTPYKFTQFSTDFMGKWEWAQAHWWWLYFAENRDVSEAYYVWWKWTWLLIDDEKAWLVDEVDRFWKEWAMVYEDFVYHRINHRWKPLKELRNDIIKRYKDEAAEWKNEEKVIKKQFTKRYLKAESEAERDALKDMYDELYEGSHKYYEQAEKRAKIADELSKRVDSTFSLYTVEIPDRIAKPTPTFSNYLDEGMLLSPDATQEFVRIVKEKLPHLAEKFEANVISNWYARWWRVTWREIYIYLEDLLWWDAAASHFLETIWYDWIEYIWWRDWRAWVIFDWDNVKINDRTAYQRVWTVWPNEKDIWADVATKLKLFETDRTVESIAKEYWIDIDIVKSIVTPDWEVAYGRYWYWIINIAEIAKESTAPHELFHAVFDIVDKETKQSILNNSMKLFWYNAVEAEEALADAFSQWFRTWKFDYADVSKLTKKEQNSFLNKVKEFFKKLKDWIDWVDAHKVEVQNLFNDMVNMKYLPNDGKPVNQFKAIQKYNEWLEESANAYFASMLWHPEWANSNYRDTLHSMLEDITWISIKSLRDLVWVDKTQLWKAVDTQFTNAQKITWKFKNEVTDITNRINQISNYSNDELRDSVSKTLNWLIDENAFTDESAPLIKQALQDYETSWTVEEWLTNKWRLMSMANWWNAETFSLDELKEIFRNWTQATEYKRLFFPNQDLTEKQTAQYVKQINDMIFDWLTWTVAQNLVKMGYSLPLDNVREVVLWYLMWDISLDDTFVKAFLYKNWLPNSKALMDSVIDSAMPRNLQLWYEKDLYKLRAEWAKSWQINRIVEEDNPFLADTYSSLVSLINTKVWNIANGNEVKYLTTLLDNYSNLIKDKLKTWINFEEAQQLKTQLWYALDIFEQDILMPKYGRFLTPDQRSAIRNMKSYIEIVVGKEWEEWVSKSFDSLLRTNQRIVASFTDSLNNVLDKYSAIKAWLAWAWWETTKTMVNNFKDKLKSDWAVIENVNWEIVIVDAREQLQNNLDTIPSSVKWLEWIDSIRAEALDDLDNRSAYFFNQLIESAKKLDAMAKWETAMMYTIDPELNMYRFFDAFRLVDDGSDRVPMALSWNILDGNPALQDYSTHWLNNILKKDIFKKIKNKFYKDWSINIEELNGIIDKSLSENTSTLKQVFSWVTKKSKYDDLLQQIKNQYQQAFMPYTHLKDIPSGSLDWIPNVRWKINDALEEQVLSIREAIEWLPDEYREYLNSVEITTPTWQTITIQQFLDWQRPNWKKAIFDDEDILVKTADEFDLKVADTSDAKEVAKIEKINKDYRRKISNQYSEVLQSIQNQQRVVSEWERKLISRVFNNARSAARKYSLTNRLVEATDMVSWLDEEASRMIKSWLLWWKNIISFWKANRDEPLKRLEEVKEAYWRFYNMGLDAINNIAPKNEAEEMAQHLCRYFKTLERHLWSADWSVWVTTRADINRAFYNLWEVVLNIRTIEWIYALQSAIEQNQILKFFRFSNPWQTSYVREFTRPATQATEDIFGWYREYVSKLPDTINRDSFNDIFAANFSDTEYKMLYQALSWVTYVWWYWKTLQRFLNFVNWSNFLFRFLISYPWQLLTIPQQGIAYFLKQKWFERNLWIEDMSNIDRIRNEYWTLVKAYNEINLFRDVNPDNVSSTAYYNRYWMPDIADAYKWAAIELTDDVNDMYGKMMTYQSNWDNMWRLQRSIDAYKDNANNIIDWMFARNFKNIAFLKWIKENSFMQFGSAEAFEAFMKNNKIDQSVKNQLMDAVNASAWRNFRNILWLGFWWLDRAVGWNAFSNIAYWLMQFFNFRWAWWQNIFRNMWETFLSAFKMLPMGTSKEWRNAIATYIAQTPEFTNFVDILFNDMEWTWKMIRYQDNWRWSELDNEYDISDFLDYTVELLNMTSQWWQGINSFWPARPVLEAWWPEGSMFQSLENPEVYKDTYWVWAFFNALWTNAWRNWKPINYIFQAIQALEEWWPSWARAFLQNQFWKLSFWSLRYMMNEDVNDYWFTYEFMPDESWIPSIIRWEWALGSNKSFSYELSNNNTWDSIQQIFWDWWWDEKKTYIWDVWWALINGSNVWSSIKNGIKALPYWEEISNAIWLWNRKSPWSFDSFTDVVDKTEAWKELISTWKVTPKTPSEVKAFVNQFIDEDWETSNRSAYKPFGEHFAEAVSNYNQLWHIKWEEAHSWDKEMEFMLSQIRYQRREDWSFIEKNWKKLETDLWKNMIEYIRLHPADMDSTTSAISAQVFKWVEDNNDDPNYLLYQSLIWQGMADMYLTKSWNEYQDAWNKVLGWKKAIQKINKTEAQNSWIYWDNFMKYLMNSKVSWSDVNLVEYLQRLDRKSAMSASIKIIKDQLVNEEDKANLERYVTFYKDSYWNEKATLNSQYASQIEALGWIWDAIDKGNLELMMWRASNFANTYLKEDSTWLVKASAITSLINKVRSSNISPKLKIEMISALWENHAEFLQTHLPELADRLWVEWAEWLIKVVNEHIYEWDWAMNAAIWDAIMNWDWESAKKGWSASAKFKSALAVTSKLSNWYWTSWNWYWWRTDSSNNAKWVPYKLDIAKLLSATWWKWYSPKKVEIDIRTYKPTVDLSIGKDVKRTKTVQKTQEVKKSKVVL